MNQGNITDDLLVKYLAREATEAEQLQVQDWVKQSRDNKSYLDQLRLIWTQSKALAVTSTVDTGEAWAKFSQLISRPAPQPRAIPVPRSYGWVRVAAIALLLAGASVAIWLGTHGSTATEGPAVATAAAPASAIQPAAVVPGPAQPQQPAPSPTVTTATHMVQQAVNTTYIPPKRSTPQKPPADNSSEATAAGSEGVEQFYDHYRTKEFVCNGTPCPLEICIIQSVKCPGSVASAVASCSTLLPDQSGQLKYKAPTRVEENCKVTVQEIRIKRLTTGETIVLNEHSKPATAEEVFNYITGRKKGDILAGIFHADCNNDDHEHGLKLENNYGNLILQ